MQMAKREFLAFSSAVKELHGPEQAQLSAIDCLDELELMDSQPGSSSQDWRALTIAASARLASRLKAGPHDRSCAEDSRLTRWYRRYLRLIVWPSHVCFDAARMFQTRKFTFSTTVISPWTRLQKVATVPHYTSVRNFSE
jgi:hypothetical protein